MAQPLDWFLGGCDETHWDDQRPAFRFVLHRGHPPAGLSRAIKVGGEYLFMDVLSLRAGYVMPSDEKGISLGAGLQTEISDLGFRFDYAYTRFGRFGNVNRLSVNLSL
jgi:hypothetical protein